jgi:polyphosphate kinase 2 (PPK2 family)
MKLNANDFRLQSGKKVKLSKWPTTLDHFFAAGDEYQDVLAKHVAELSSLQQLLYASHHYALLLIFQGMDGAGKDGAIRHVLSGVNPEGCEVFSLEPRCCECFLQRTDDLLFFIRSEILRIDLFPLS